MFIFKSAINSMLLILSILISKVLFRIFGEFLDPSGLMFWCSIILIFFILNLIIEWTLSIRKQKHNHYIN
ncbi:bacteriocin-like WGxF protein [Bacillus sp. NPDC077411]|uniref:bacteriocin-like WGxF protein n=1 Tax=Bacillus sp. NPDC077411 TaxID=3363947 RepID=UPI0037CAEFCB